MPSRRLIAGSETEALVFMGKSFIKYPELEVRHFFVSRREAVRNEETWEVEEVKTTGLDVAFRKKTIDVPKMEYSDKYLPQADQEEWYSFMQRAPRLFEILADIHAYNCEPLTKENFKKVVLENVPEMDAQKFSKLEAQFESESLKEKHTSTSVKKMKAQAL